MNNILIIIKIKYIYYKINEEKKNTYNKSPFYYSKNFHFLLIVFSNTFLKFFFL